MTVRRTSALSLQTGEALSSDTSSQAAGSLVCPSAATAAFTEDDTGEVDGFSPSGALPGAAVRYQPDGTQRRCGTNVNDRERQWWLIPGPVSSAVPRSCRAASTPGS